MSSRVSFQMPMGGWTKWNSKSKLALDLEAMLRTGLLDGKSALDIQLEHPAYQIFNPSNFTNNVSRLRSKLGLESAATVTFASPQVVPSHSPPPSFVQAHPCLESQAMQPPHDPRSMSSPMVAVRSKQGQHGNVSLATDDDRFRLSGHLKLELPYIMDEWSDGEHSFLSFQIAQLAGPPMKWYVSTDGKSLIGDYRASRNLVDPEKALSGFVDKNKKKLYEKMHGRYVARKLSVREMRDDETEQVLMRQVIHLPFPCETRFIVKEKKDLHYVKFSNGEVFLFLHLVEVGGHPDTAPRPPPAVSAPPASILFVSNSVAPDMDELTHNVSEWGGVSVPTTRRSQRSRGGSRMDWTWRTATESNRSMTNSPKSPSSVQEGFREVSEPNPMGNAVTSEETHGNVVAGAAAASAVAQPPVDTASLASSRTNKRRRTRHVSSGQSHRSGASVPSAK